MLTEKVLSHFHGVRGCNGHYMALCPAHEDHNPSLCITEADGIILIHCFAGCRAVDVLKAVGLTFEDLRN